MNVFVIIMKKIFVDIMKKIMQIEVEAIELLLAQIQEEINP